MKRCEKNNKKIKKYQKYVDKLFLATYYFIVIISRTKVFYHIKCVLSTNEIYLMEDKQMVFEKIRAILSEQLDLEEDDITMESNIAEE